MTDLEHIQHQINVNFPAYVANHKEQLERDPPLAYTPRQ